MIDFVGFTASYEETLTAPLAQTQLPEVPASSRFTIFLCEISLKKKIRGWLIYRQMNSAPFSNNLPGLNALSHSNLGLVIAVLDWSLNTCNKPGRYSELHLNCSQVSLS